MNRYAKNIHLFTNMAAGLNIRANFDTKSTDDLVLLPPSSFETSHTKVDPWQALAKATGEILDLKQENTKLKETKQVAFPLGEEIKARVNLHHSHSSPVIQTPQPPPPPQPHPHSSQIQLSHYHELINRQATEITSLQRKLGDTNTEAEKNIARLESQIALKDAHCTQQVAALEEKLRESQRLVEDERSRARAVDDKWSSDHSAVVAEWREEVALVDARRRDQVDQLSAQLGDVTLQLGEATRELEEKTKEHASSLSAQQDTITQLQAYLRETQTSAKSTEIWRQDTDRLKLTVQDKETEILKLESEIDLLKIRLQSQNDILSIQEKAVSKIKDSSNDKKKQCLLTRWREKVYALLVQLKCAEIVKLDQEHQWKNKLYAVRCELETSIDQCSVLQCGLTDKQAELDIERNTNRTLEEELMRAQQVAIKLDDQTKQDNEAMRRVLDDVKRFEAAFQQLTSIHSAVLSALSTHSQRVTYASGRVEVLQSQFARREALLHIQLAQNAATTPTTDHHNDITAEPSPSAELRAELSRVTVERDTLAAQMKADAGLLEGKVTAAREHVAEEVASLRQRLEELHTEVENKTTLCSKLQADVESSKAHQEETTETIDQLKALLAQAQLSTQQEVEAARVSEKNLFTEQLAAMEHKLNEARREHTKAVVSLRQSSRQQARDKERAEDLTATLEGHYKAEVARLEAKLRATETDRNLLMTTIRQEGLMGKIKSQRPTPLDCDPDIPHTTTPHVVAGYVGGHGDNEPPTRDVITQGEDSERITLGRQKVGGAQYKLENGLDTEEPLHVVIDDLKSLTRAVLDDNNDDESDIDDSFTYSGGFTEGSPGAISESQGGGIEEGRVTGDLI